MNWLPTEVEVSLNSFALSRSHLSTGAHFATWELAARKNGSGYNFNGSIFENLYQDLYLSNPSHCVTTRTTHPHPRRRFTPIPLLTRRHHSAIAHNKKHCATRSMGASTQQKLPLLPVIQHPGAIRGGGTTIRQEQEVVKHLYQYCQR